MSGFNTAIAGMILAALGVGAVDLVVPDRPITVHSLRYDPATQAIIQARTVDTDAPFFVARWDAEIILTDTGETVCAGGMVSKYKPGFLDDPMTIPYWVGQDPCDLVPGREYIAQAVWQWGSEYTSKRSEPFIFEAAQ